MDTSMFIRTELTVAAAVPDQDSTATMSVDLPQETTMTVVEPSTSLVKPEEFQNLAQASRVFKNFYFEDFLPMVREMDIPIPDIDSILQLPDDESPGAKILFAEKMMDAMREIAEGSKLSTMLSTFKDRLAFINQVVKKLHAARKTEDLESLNFSSLLIGQFLSSYTKGWIQTELAHVFREVFLATNLTAEIHQFLSGRIPETSNANPNQVVHQQMALRATLRLIFLNAWTDDADRFFCLTQLLQPYIVFDAAKLILLIFGPLIESAERHPEVGWWKPAETSISGEEIFELVACFKLLARNIKQRSSQFVLRPALTSNAPLLWDIKTLASIYGHVTTFPDNWLPQNRAELLAGSGVDLVKHVFRDKIQVVTPFKTYLFASVARDVVYLALHYYRKEVSGKSFFELLRFLFACPKTTPLAEKLMKMIIEEVGDLIILTGHLISPSWIDDTGVSFFNDMVKMHCTLTIELITSHAAFQRQPMDDADENTGPNVSDDDDGSGYKDVSAETPPASGNAEESG